MYRRWRGSKRRLLRYRETGRRYTVRSFFRANTRLKFLEGFRFFVRCRSATFTLAAGKVFAILHSARHTTEHRAGLAFRRQIREPRIVLTSNLNKQRRGMRLGSAKTRGSSNLGTIPTLWRSARLVSCNFPLRSNRQENVYRQGWALFFPDEHGLLCIDAFESQKILVLSSVDSKWI